MEAEREDLYIAERRRILLEQGQGSASRFEGVHLRFRIRHCEIDGCGADIGPDVHNGFDPGQERNTRIGDSGENVIRNLETHLGLEQVERQRAPRDLEGGLRDFRTIQYFLAHSLLNLPLRVPPA